MIIDTFEYDLCKIFASNSLSIKLMTIRKMNSAYLSGGFLEEMVHFGVSSK